MNLRFLTTIVCLFLLSESLLFSSTVNTATGDSLTAGITAIRVDKGPQINGKLDDPLWIKALSFKLKYEINPGDNINAGQKTIVRALYDDKYLYLGFRCYDTCASDIRAHVCNRDQIFSDDYVITCIDTDNNYQRAYEFAVNPYGIQGDLLFIAPGNEDSSYDMI